MSIGNALLSGVRAARPQVTTNAPASSVEFIEAPWGLRMRLFPVQRVILKAHYGEELDSKTKFKFNPDFRRQKVYEMTEVEYLRYLHEEGRCNIKEVIPGKPRREMNLCLGRRSGKTTISASVGGDMVRQLILKNDPRDYYGLPPTNPIQLVAVATDKEQAGILYQEVSGHFRGCPFFAPYTANNTQSYARFQTPDDISKYGSYADDPTARATIRFTFKSCVAKGLRGSGNIYIVLDEVAHFTDEGESSAEKVYEAVVPAAAAFSHKNPADKSQAIGPVESVIILISSPMGRQGLFYQKFMQAWEPGSDNMLSVRAPTWEVNPSVEASFLESRYRDNPNSFFTEFGGQFSDRAMGWLEGPEEIRPCIDPTARPAQFGIPRKSYYVGIDVGLSTDGTAVAIGHLDGDRIVTDLVDQIKAGEGRYVNQSRLEFDEVADWIYGLSKKFSFREGMFDQWAGIPFQQALAKRGLPQLKSVAMTADKSSEIYRNFKNMLWDKRVQLYNYPVPQGEEFCDYIRELLELQATYHSKHILTVEAPKIKGKHDDLSDALARMVWLASNAMSGGKSIASPISSLPSFLRPVSVSPLSVLKSRRSGSDIKRMVPKGRFR